MKVICAGFPKTGTKSLHAALEILGYSVYDYTENIFLHSDVWQRILDSGWTTDDFKRLYENVDAVCDAPACYFWDEILKAFPDAKVILTTRQNEDVWIKSIEKQMEVLRDNKFLGVSKLLSPTCGRVVKAQGSLERVIFGVSLMNWGENGLHTDLLKKKYREHMSFVRNNTKPDQLLDYRCEEGWGPICKFLGADVPDVPFPHKNKRGGILQETKNTDPMLVAIKTEFLRSSALIVVATAVIGACVLKWAW